jgi:hypothetical protein
MTRDVHEVEDNILDPMEFESDRRKNQARFASHAMRGKLAPPSLLLCRLCHCAFVVALASPAAALM